MPGAGVGVTTFLSLSLLLGMETKRAIPTSVVCAGWSSLAPLLAYWVYIQVMVVRKKRTMVVLQRLRHFL